MHVKSSTSFLSFFVQFSQLIQMMIENCHQIFGKEITSLSGEVSVNCETKENAPGIVNNWVVFCERHTSVKVLGRWWSQSPEAQMKGTSELSQ